MKKIALLIACLLCLPLVLYIIFLWPSQEKIEEVSEEEVSQGEVVLDLEEIEKLRRKQIIEEKIKNLRQKYAVRWLIAEWDALLEKNKNLLALKLFLSAYKKNPENEALVKKIWDSYFAMHKYSSAYRYYKKITNPEVHDEKYYFSFLYKNKNFSPENIEQLASGIDDFWSSEQEKYFHEQNVLCITDFHLCKKNFWEYFSVQEGEEEKEITEEKLLLVKQTIENYENFQLDDVIYKNALLAGAYMQMELFPFSIHFWKQILEIRPDYKPVLKILAKSYLELWDFENAGEYLTRFYKIDEKDAEVLFLLWVTYQEKKEYLLSNIYFEKSLHQGYESLPIRRFMVMNAYKMENYSGMLSVMEDILEKESPSEQDYILGIYFHILYDASDVIAPFIQQWRKKYPESDYLLAYQAWSKREREDFVWAKEDFRAVLQKNPDNPLALLNLGQILASEWQSDEAREFLLQVRDFGIPEFEDVAVEGLKKLKR